MKHRGKEKKKTGRKTRGPSISEPRGHLKQPKTQGTGVFKREERQGKPLKNLMAEKRSNLMKIINLQIQEAQQIVSKRK